MVAVHARKEAKAPRAIAPITTPTLVLILCHSFNRQGVSLVPRRYRRPMEGSMRRFVTVESGTTVKESRYSSGGPGEHDVAEDGVADCKVMDAMSSGREVGSSAERWLGWVLEQVA